MSEYTISSEIPPATEVIEIRKRIEKLEAIIASVDTAKLRLITEFAINIGAWRCNQCKLNVNNICTGWRLSKEFADKVNAIAGGDTIILQENIYRINLAKLPFIGVICPIFVAKT
jgi:hypothetical protein